jgi:hypothetical protein
MQGAANRLRATRASPPGMASADGIRRDTYGAALQQFDELMTAAAAIGPMSRPLPVYYAVLQAGKAIGAAWSDRDPPVGGHGLTEVRPAKGSGECEPPEWHCDILRFRVKPHGRDPGVFAAVSAALGAPRLTAGVELGALWSALPEVTPPPDASSWLQALPVHPHIYDAEVPKFMSSAYRGFVCFRGHPAPQTAAEINGLLARYPDGADARAVTYGGEPMVYPTAHGLGFSVSWPEPDVQVPLGGPIPAEIIMAQVHSRIPVYRRTSEQWLIPLVGDGQNQLPPILLWWILLFGLSLLARYQPAAWRAALDLDRSPCADPLVALLDEALEIVPDLLYDAATQPRPRNPA